MAGRDEFKQVAEETYFDPDNCDKIDSEDTQGAIEDLCEALQDSASPGFTWGRSGNSSTNTWLLNDTVPSNRAGRTVMLAGVKIANVFVATENLNTYTVSIYEHEGDGINLTFLTSISVVSARSAQITVDVPITQNRQLAARITAGSCKNIVAGLVIKGDS